MERKRTIALCRLFLLLLTLMELGPLHVAAGALPSSPLRRQKKSIMDMQLSSSAFPSSFSEEDDEDEVQDDDNESGLDDENLKVNSEEDDEEEEDDEGLGGGWTSDIASRSPFRERRVAHLLNPITSSGVSKRSAGHHETLKTVFSERARENGARLKRQRRKIGLVRSKPRFPIGGPDPSRAHATIKTRPPHHYKYFPSNLLTELDIDEDGKEDYAIIEKKSLIKPKLDGRYYYIDYSEEEDDADNNDNDDDDDNDEENADDFGTENSREDEEKAIDAALKHLSWQRLTKRLIELEGVDGPYLDRGERRMYGRALKKRSSPFGYRSTQDKETKKELEDIFSDDFTAVKLKRSYNEATKKITLQNANENNNKSKTVLNDTNSAAMILGDRATANKKQNVPRSKEESGDGDREKISKGKQWVPFDSERTLRSKKSWDHYFGYDKRSASGTRRKSFNSDTRVLDNENDSNENNEEQESEVEDDDNEDDERNVNKKKLQDDLIKWYFDKLLLKSNSRNAKPLKLENEDTDDDKNDSDERSKESVVMVEVDKSGNEIWSKRVDERLRQMEDALLTDATKLLEKEVENSKKESSSSSEKTERVIMDHLKAAFSLEKMRGALEEFQATIAKLDAEPSSSEEANSDVEDKKRKKKSVKKKKSIIEPSTEMSMGLKSSIINGPRDLSSEVAPPVFLSENSVPDLSFPPCPLTMTALGYCEELSDAVGEMGKLLSRSCVEHMLCYTCDKSPGSCNRAFLQEVEALCDDDFRCQAIAGAMRSVFLSNHDEFRRRNNALCEVDQCLARLLQKK